MSELRGVAARIPVEESSMGRIRAKPDQPLDSPILVRVLDEPDGSQVVEFVGTVAGEYDLSAWLERIDGRALESAAPMTVTIVSSLPVDRAADLAGDSASPPSVTGLPFVLIIVVAAAWLLLPIIAILRRRPAAPVIAPVAERAATMQEEIAALAGESRGRALSTAERGRLELLLMRFWRERARGGASSSGLAALNLPPNATDAEIIRALRDHPEARGLMIAMEEWLHRAPEESVASADRAATELERFLQKELDATSAGRAP